MKRNRQKATLNKRISKVTSSIIGLALLVFAFTAPSTIEDVFFPGSQDGDSGRFENPDRCRSCHENYNTEIEPYFNWSGSMMAQAARDPLYEVSCYHKSGCTRSRRSVYKVSFAGRLAKRQIP